MKNQTIQACLMAGQAGGMYEMVQSPISTADRAAADDDAASLEFFPL